MADEVSSIGVLFQMGDGGSPEIFSTIGGITDVPTIGTGSTEDIDVTALEDTFKRTMKGYKDLGETSLNLNIQKGNTAHKQLKDDADSSAKVVRNYQIKAGDSADVYITFSAYAKNFEAQASSGDKFTATVGIVFDSVPQFPILD